MGLYAIDGTWNRLRDGEEQSKNTNVLRFSKCYERDPLFYVPGVGTKLGFFGRVFGGAFGFGAEDRVDQQYDSICRTYLAGHQPIEIIGFSRGAALALDLANRVFRNGIRNPATGKREVKAPEIRFLGLWDTVGSFGLTLGPFQKINLGHHLGVPPNVTHCFHALALDERRSNFKPTRLGARAYEVWFRGVHSDVGGGNENFGLNNITLRWMLRKAFKVGLPVNLDAGPADSAIDATTPISEPLDPIATGLRHLLAGDRVHYTVNERNDGRCNNPGPDCVIETGADERDRIP